MCYKSSQQPDQLPDTAATTRSDKGFLPAEVEQLSLLLSGSVLQHKSHLHSWFRFAHTGSLHKAQYPSKAFRAGQSHLEEIYLHCHVDHVTKMRYKSQFQTVALVTTKRHEDKKLSKSINVSNFELKQKAEVGCVFFSFAR